LQLELVDPYDPRVEAIWRTLEDQARPTYFLMWGWVENWLACLPRHEAPQLAVITHDGAPVAACFLGKRRLRRHGFVPSRALYVNTTGLPDYDELCIEHNGLVVRPDHGLSLASLVQLIPGDWDELFLPAVDGDAFAALAGAPLPDGMRVRIDREVANYHIDLERVRQSKDGYVALLGSSTRAQMRKAMRAAGDVTFEVAADDRAAQDIYDELVALHQRSWRMRGHPGAFADPWFDRFHRRLIAKRFRHGEIQLVRLRAGELTIGCLYNFIADGRVLFYQCGFGSPADRHIRPGYLCHAHAIEHCAREGLAIYDLLGGDARYKSSLATDETRLVWGRVQRRRLQFQLEDRARAWLRSRAQP
jgi:CelD/BcsL family acetyltransferase involved in cellulose biosynthesis